MPSTSDAKLREEARQLAQSLGEYRDKEAQQFPELGQRAGQLEDELRERLDILQRPAPRVAFVAHKGVGKSTLINALANLWLDGTPPPPDATSKLLNQHALLPLGNGGTTPCEIQVEAGAWEVRVEPEKLAETQANLRQFAEWAWHKAHDQKKQPAESIHVGDESDPEPDESALGGRPPRLQPDLERVIQGMTSLQEQHITSQAPTGVRGKRSTTTRHEAVELAVQFLEKAAFVAEVERRAHLAERRRQQWLPEGDERRWLRETLLNLFEGKFADQPFPKRVTIRVPSTGVRMGYLDLPLIDTLGLPAVASGRGDGEPAPRPTHPLAEREDLRYLLKEPWTLVVIGAQFNEPPAPSVELFQQMMEEAIYFGETLEDRTVVAIIDPGKAGAGNFDDADTERAKKEDRCAENMVRLGCPRGPEAAKRWSVDAARERIFCVNVLDGGTEPFQEFVRTAVERMNACHEQRLLTAVSEARAFFQNLGDARRQAIRQQVVAGFKHQLSAAARTQVGKVRAFRSNVLHAFADECRALHHSTLRSVIVHRGDGKRSAWAMLESATARELGRLLKPLRDQIDITSDALQSDTRFQDESARDVIAEEADRRRRIIKSFVKAFIERFVEVTKERLIGDGPIWRECEGEWGRGLKDPRYKERVASHFESWGVDHSPELLDCLNALAEQAEPDDTGMLRSLIDG